MCRPGSESKGTSDCTNTKNILVLQSPIGSLTKEGCLLSSSPTILGFALQSSASITNVRCLSRQNLPTGMITVVEAIPRAADCVGHGQNSGSRPFLDEPFHFVDSCVAVQQMPIEQTGVVDKLLPTKANDSKSACERPKEALQRRKSNQKRRSSRIRELPLEYQSLHWRCCQAR